MARNLQSRTLTDAGLRAFIETNAPERARDLKTGKWDFDRLTLAAFYFHPNLDVARAQWRVAQAGVKTDGGRPNPTLTVTPGYDVSALSSVNPWFLAVNCDLPIDLAHSVRQTSRPALEPDRSIGPAASSGCRTSRHSARLH